MPEPLQKFAMRNLTYIMGGFLIICPLAVGNAPSLTKLVAQIINSPLAGITGVGVTLTFLSFFLGLAACETVRVFLDRWKDCEWIPVNHITPPVGLQHISDYLSNVSEAKKERIDRAEFLMHVATAAFAGGLFGIPSLMVGCWFAGSKFALPQTPGQWVSLVLLGLIILFGLLENRRVKRYIREELTQNSNLPATQNGTANG